MVRRTDPRARRQRASTRTSRSSSRAPSAVVPRACAAKWNARLSPRAPRSRRPSRATTRTRAAPARRALEHGASGAGGRARTRALGSAPDERAHARRSPSATAARDRRRQPLARARRALDRRCRRCGSTGAGASLSTRASSIACGTPTPCVETARALSAARSPASSSRTSPGRAPEHRIDHDHRIRAREQIDELASRRAPRRARPPCGTPSRAQPLEHREADAVVARGRLADADHPRARGHSPSTRKRAGSASRTRCTGRGCGSSARSAAPARVRGSVKFSGTTLLEVLLDRALVLRRRRHDRASRIVPSRRAGSGGRGARAAPRWRA